MRTPTHGRVPRDRRTSLNSEAKRGQLAARLPQQKTAQTGGF